MPKFHWMRQMADRAELLEEAMPAQPVVELLGEGRVLIEGHKGVSAYSDQEIDVKTRLGIVKISGCNLKLTNMSAYRLVISGMISCVHLSGRRQK